MKPPAKPPADGRARNPFATFAKRRLLLVADEAYAITSAIQTFF